jgi:hypothetical protein
LPSTGKTPGKFKLSSLVWGSSGRGLGDGWGGGEAGVMPLSLPTGQFVHLTCIKKQEADKQHFEFSQPKCH